MTVDDYVRAVVQEAPPLTPTQRAKLAILLGGTDARVGDAA